MAPALIREPSGIVTSAMNAARLQGIITGVGVGVKVSVGVGVRVGVKLAVMDGVGEAVRVIVGYRLGVTVSVLVGLGLRVSVLVGNGLGRAATKVSSALIVDFCSSRTVFVEDAKPPVIGMAGTQAAAKSATRIRPIKEFEIFIIALFVVPIVICMICSIRFSLFEKSYPCPP